MNCKTPQLRGISYCLMLVIQVSKANSEPGQAYKIGFLAKIVNGLKFILRLTWWTLIVCCLDTWIGDPSDLTDLKTKKTVCLVTLNHLYRDPLDAG